MVVGVSLFEIRAAAQSAVLRSNSDYTSGVYNV